MTHSTQPHDVSRLIWGIVDLLRDTYARSDYAQVILPFTLLRRLDCAGALDQSAGEADGEGAPSTFAAALADPTHLADNLKRALGRLDPAFAEVLALLDVEHTIDALEKNRLLIHVVRAFSRIDLSPLRLDNHAMGSLFEEVVRTCVESADEHPGEHYTPRDVIRLVAALLLAPDRETWPPARVRTIYDPCCGTGGFLTGVAACMQESGRDFPPVLYGQEVNAVTYAICKADLLLSGKSSDAAHIRLGNTLSHPAHPGLTFDLLICNPPYGVSWKNVQSAVVGEASSAGPGGGRFGAGLPRVSDGQLLFLQHLLSHARPAELGDGSRIAIVFSASPLYAGGAASGESEIRRWILENDWLEAIVALPEQLFYNTGIATYVWVLTNRKEQRRRGKVQLIDAREDYVPLRKHRGEKRRELAPGQIDQILERYLACAEGPHCKLFAPADFGYRTIVVARPLRLNFQASPDRLARLGKQPAFQALALPRRAGGDEEQGHSPEQALLCQLAAMPGTLCMDRAAFVPALHEAARRAGIALSAPLLKALLAALSERDEGAEICRTASGTPESDPQLRDSENVPLGEDPLAFFAREVLPFWGDAWVDLSVRDSRDGQLGKVGYEIHFTRAFFTYQAPRPLAEIAAEILALERECEQHFKALHLEELAGQAYQGPCGDGEDESARGRAHGG
jgi:type I restriction enzyme M protein